MKQFFRFSVLAVGVFSCALQASEMRAPLVTERGPLRYDFALKKDKWSLNWWSQFYARDADKAFTKHGTDTDSMSKMLFGKDMFKIEEIFGRDTDGQFLEQKYLFENRNPIVLGTKLAPRFKYEENGVSMGARFEYPVCAWGMKGRVGARINVPFRTVRTERDDEGECAALPTQECVVRNDIVRIEGANDTAVIIDRITRYKLGLLTNLRRLNAAGQIQCAVNLRDPNFRVNTGGRVTGPDAIGAGDFIPVTTQGGQVKFNKTVALIGSSPYTGTQIPFVIHQGNANGEPPFGQPTGITVFTNSEVGVFSLSDHTDPVKFARNVDGAGGIEALAANGSTTEDIGYIFASDYNYSSLSQQDNFDQLWASIIQRGDGKGLENLNSASEFQAFVDAELDFYNLTSADCWLKDNCDLVLQSNQRSGLGDIDLDVFYEHTFNDDWRMEVMFGVRIPVASDNNICKNPLAVSLGNNDHWEIKLGVMGAWHAFKWLNLKADMYYSFVLEDTECRPAAFKNETKDKCGNICAVRNFAPCVPAKVDWGYFVGRLDATWFHHKSNKLAGTLGYEFYYKTSDNVSFKCCETTNHCLGKVWANEDGTPITKDMGVDDIVNPSFQDYKMALSNKNAERDTERIAHRIRWESNWRATKYLNLYLGGAYTFAGKNIPRESDFFAGFMTRW